MMYHPSGRDPLYDKDLTINGIDGTLLGKGMAPIFGAGGLIGGAVTGVLTSPLKVSMNVSQGYNGTKFGDNSKDYDGLSGAMIGLGRGISRVPRHIYDMSVGSGKQAFYKSIGRYDKAQIEDERVYRTLFNAD